MSPKCYIGTSGWHYDHWRGIFYPRELAKDNWLGFYSRQFNSVEINNSFYRLPRESTIANWHAEVSPDFRFAAKVSRFITHIKRLKDSETPLQTFNNRVNHLGSNLGPLLYQLPPTLQRDDERLEMFLRLLATWAEKLNKLSSKLKDLYVYFNHDAGGFAVENALTLRKFLEGK